MAGSDEEGEEAVESVSTGAVMVVLQFSNI